MELVFRHVGLDFGKFPNLVPQGLGVQAPKLATAPPTGFGFQGDGFIAVLRGQQRPLVFGMPRLSAWFPGGVTISQP
jgi:hypothetical protein